jgi:hypothetical protein
VQTLLVKGDVNALVVCEVCELGMVETKKEEGNVENI